jgi:hypothetical protein
MPYYNKIFNTWETHGFEILLISIAGIMFIISIYNKIKGKRGSYSDMYISPYSDNRPHAKAPAPKRKGPPKDSKGEIECKRVLENIFNAPFDRDRPDFLRNPVSGGNNNLELDCFNPYLKLACEYNGRQHYDFIPFFHKTKDSFMNQKYRDLMKADMCRKNNINLIVVPYYVKIKDIESYIYKNLRDIGYDV